MILGEAGVYEYGVYVEWSGSRVAVLTVTGRVSGYPRAWYRSVS